jgi:hypothetical protein
MKVKWHFLWLSLALTVVGVALLIGHVQVPGVVVCTLALLAAIASRAPGTGAAGAGD